MEEWNEYKLEEIGDVIGGATPSTKNASNYDGEISWITPKDLSNFNGRFIAKGERTITKIGYESCSCKMLPKGSILFSSRAPIGYVAIAEKELCTNQGFKSLIPDENIVNNIFLYYLLVYQKDNIEGLGSGTTFKEISGKVMKSVKVKLPSLPTQRKIASILSSLDDKIELNRRINANLEAQAQALFKSWFIDFEPFKDGKFVDSELGMIPEGWEVRRIADVVDIMVGGDKPKSYSKSKSEECVIPIYSNGIDKEGLYGFTNEPRILKDSVTISARGTIGYVCLRKQPYMPIVRLICLVPTSQYMSAEYIYLWALNEHIMGVGTTQQQLTVPNFKIKRITLPTESVMRIFNKTATTLFNTIENNKEEIQRLSALRDTLLPKLMSGEIEI